MNEFAILTSIVASAVVLMCTAGCSGGREAATSPPKSTSGSVSTSGNANSPSTSTNPQPAGAHGIIVVDENKTGSACKVSAIDPTSGKMSTVSEFPIDAGRYNCNDDPMNSPLVYSSNFDRVAITSNQDRPGWMDTSGKFTPAGQQPSTPQFGDQVETIMMGFDRLDNFYTQTEINGDVQLYRTPAGSTGPGDLVPKTDGPIGRLPGGLIGYGAQRYVFSGCSNDEPVDGDFDPEKNDHFYVNNGIVFRDAEYCSNSGKPLTVKANFTIGKAMATSPDESMLAFIGGSNLYLVDTKAGGVPKELPVSGGAVSYSTIRAWLT